MASVKGVSNYEDAGNIHLRVDEKLKPHEFHKVVQRLACKYAKSGASLLDVGCGMGNIPLLVNGARPDLKISIADAYEICLETTAKKVGPAVVAKYKMDETDFDVETIPEKFDIITLSHVLEHLLDPVNGVRKLMDRLNPGGHLIIAVPNPSRPIVVVTNMFQYHYVNRGHVASWDPSHFRNFLGKILGLDVVEYATDSVRPLPGFLGTGLAKILPWWGFSNIAVIRKPE